MNQISEIQPSIILNNSPTLFWTQATIKRVALGALAALNIAGVVALSMLTVVPLSLIAIPLTLLSLFLSYTSFQIKDYENPEKLSNYQARAAHQTFKELCYDHGIKNIIQYQILPIEQLKEKINRQVQTMDFESVLKHFDVDLLIEHQIITPDHANLLRDLQNQARLFKQEYEGHIREIDLRFKERSERLQSKVWQAKIVTDLALTQGKNGSFEASRNANAMTLPIAFIGDMAAQKWGKEEQLNYETALNANRHQFHSRLNDLENQYTQFKSAL